MKAASKLIPNYLKILLSSEDIELYTQDIYGKTALFYAYHYLENLQLLVETDCTGINILNNESQTILDVCKPNVQKEIFLRNYGAKTSAEIDAELNTELTRAKEAQNLQKAFASTKRIREFSPIFNDYQPTYHQLPENPVVFKAPKPIIPVAFKAKEIFAKRALQISTTVTPEPTSFETTPLIEAIKRDNNLEIATMLLRSKEWINTTDKHGWTPLMHAICSSITVAKLLLAAGADANIPDNNGMTPLMVAASQKYTDFVDLLLKNGATVNNRNNDGLTALDRSSHENVSLLRSRFAKTSAELKNEHYSDFF